MERVSTDRGPTPPAGPWPQISWQQPSPAQAAKIHPPPHYRQIPSWRGPVPASVEAGAANPWCWVVGLHGGAGVSSLIALIEGVGDARRKIPADESQSPYFVAVVRTHWSGLLAAQDLAAQKRANLVAPSALCLGLVTVADAPGRLPKTLQRFRKLVEAAYPQTWHVPWMTEWRELPAQPGDDQPPEIQALARDLSRLTGRERG